MKLVEFPDVSDGRNINIEIIYLNWCGSLVKLSPSVQHLPKLKILNLVCCRSMENAPTTFDSKVLEILDPRECGCVKMFPEFTSRNSIRELLLDKTDIREVPSSVELLKGLEKLFMRGCEKLSIISTNVCKLKSLSVLDLSDCTNLESFPEIMKPMESLKHLNLSGCTRLKRLPNDHSFHNLKSLEKLHLDDTAITDLPESICQLFEMKYLYLCGCKCLRSLPASMKQLSQLLHLFVEGCSNLCSLPELPSSLETLDANGCFSLKTISSACFASESKTRILKFANCFNWDEEERRRVLDIAFSILQYMLSPRGNPNSEKFEIMLPWSEIPQWLCGSQSVGSSLTLKLPMDDRYYRFAFCVVIKLNYGNSFFYNYMNCYVDDDDACEFNLEPSDTEHLLLWYQPRDNELRKYVGREISLQFRNKTGEVEVTRCGVVIL